MLFFTLFTVPQSNQLVEYTEASISLDASAQTQKLQICLPGGHFGSFDVRPVDMEQWSFIELGFDEAQRIRDLGIMAYPWFDPKNRVMIFFDKDSVPKEKKHRFDFVLNQRASSVC